MTVNTINPSLFSNANANKKTPPISIHNNVNIHRALYQGILTCRPPVYIHVKHYIIVQLQRLRVTTRASCFVDILYQTNVEQ